MQISVAKSVCTIEALHRAAYRAAHLGAAQISEGDSEWHVQLLPLKEADQEPLKHEFLINLSDESLREIIRARTDPLRSLILAHAYSNTRLSGEDSSA